MNAIKKFLFLVASVTGILNIQAQQIPMFTHYMYNTLAVNPAYAGSREVFTVAGLYRMQWVDFKGAPATQTLTLHSPLRNPKIGLGLSVLNDKIGPTNNTSIFGDFAYRMNVGSRSKLAFGLSGGINAFQARLSTVDLDQSSDPVFQTDIRNHITPNFGFGIYYSRTRFYAGLSVPSLLENDYSSIQQPNGSMLVGSEQRHYFFIMGAMLNLSENLAFKPTTLVKMTMGAPVQADFTASFILLKKMLLGAMYRTGDSFGALIGFDITSQLHLGYSFDWSFGLSTGKYNNGSHEIVLRFDALRFDKKQIHSPRYF